MIVQAININKAGRFRSGDRTVGGCSSVGRAPVLQAGGRRFDPDQLHQLNAKRELSEEWFKKNHRSLISFEIGRRIELSSGCACSLTTEYG